MHSNRGSGANVNSESASDKIAIIDLRRMVLREFGKKLSGRADFFPSMAPRWGGRGGTVGVEDGRGWIHAQEKTSTCAVSALLRTRNDQGAPQGRILDPTTKVGLQASTALLAPSGYSIGSSKASPVHEHRRGLHGRDRPHRGNLPRPGARCKRVETIPRLPVAEQGDRAYNEAKAGDAECGKAIPNRILYRARGGSQCQP
jgi:hypothetical protein